MCDETENEHSNSTIVQSTPMPMEEIERIRANPTLSGYARYLVNTEQKYRFGKHQAGFVAYGDISVGDKVLLAVSNLHDSEIVEEIARAIHEKGANIVDVLVLDNGPDHDMAYDEEIKRIVRTKPWWVDPRWYDYQEKVINYAKDNGYNMLIHGRGGPIPDSNSKGETLPYKFEAIPWQMKDVFLSGATIFPPDLNYLINVKSWEMIYKQGRGGKVHVTDPEGTDINFTLHEKYFGRSLDGRGGFGPAPTLGHLFGHSTPPIIQEEDSSGVVAGTTSHITRPFPQINVTLSHGKIQEIRGGGEYGEAWREIVERTNNVQYPEFPSNGLFWLWELAIGTNPKVRRPIEFLRLGSGGFEIERSRSGVIHAGFGTRWRGPSERWAAEHGKEYGHLHVHMLFPTYEITTLAGRTITVIEHGRLKVLDDPDVRSLASKYGDPDELLKEDWTPKIPGINDEGSYSEFARNPYSWYKKRESAG